MHIRHKQDTIPQGFQMNATVPVRLGPLIPAVGKCYKPSQNECQLNNAATPNRGDLLQPARQKHTDIIDLAASESTNLPGLPWKNREFVPAIGEELVGMMNLHPGHQPLA